MFDKKLFLDLVLVAVVVALMFAYVEVRWNNTSTVVDLEGVEIREYEGKDHSSINTFRENSIKGPQYVDSETYRLAITGLVNNELEYTYDEVVNGNQLFKKIVTLNCVEGWSVTLLLEGVLVEDLIQEAGVDPSATTVIFYAYDGYSTSVPLDYLVDNNILVAYKHTHLNPSLFYIITNLIRNICCSNENHWLSP